MYVDMPICTLLSVALKRFFTVLLSALQHVENCETEHNVTNVTP